MVVHSVVVYRVVLFSVVVYSVVVVGEGFYYGQECYFASKHFLSFRITTAVCLHFVDFFVYIVAINIWL